MKLNKILNTFVIALAILAIFILANPNQAKAGFQIERIVDPFCLFACDDGDDDSNSNNNSSYNTNTANYSVGAISYSCYPNSTSAKVGDSVIWSATASGGSGSYRYYWSDVVNVMDYGYGNTVSRTYSTTGSKTMGVAVIDASSNRDVTQSDWRICSGTINVSAQTNNDNNNSDRNRNNRSNDNHLSYDNNYYYDSYNYASSYRYPQLNISCYPSTTSGYIGDNITWNTYVTGGNGSYSISWSGNDGLSGYGSSIYKTYNNSGTKYASVRVTSDGQTSSQSCNNNVLIYDNYNNYNYNYNYNNSPLYVSCTANSSFAPIGSNVSWRATATGGNGYYTYRWNGTDNLVGYSNILNTIYNSIGLKSASVTVVSDGQTITQTCSNTVNVGAQNYNYNSNNYNSGLQIACYPDKVNVKIGIPVTWAVEVLGGSGNQTYSWTGTDGLSSNQNSVITTYGTVGTKSATVSVSSNGQTVSQACGSTVKVTSAVAPVVKKVNTVTPTPVQQNTNQNLQGDSLSAASLFSLSNVPWGWVVVLVILILILTIIYLIFNRNKI